MPRWKIEGADRQTGADLVFEVEAATETAAIHEGGKRAFIASVSPAHPPKPIPHWMVAGIDRATRQPRTIDVAAKDRHEAVKLAGRELTVTHVELRKTIAATAFPVPVTPPELPAARPAVVAPVAIPYASPLTPPANSSKPFPPLISDQTMAKVGDATGRLVKLTVMTVVGFFALWFVFGRSGDRSGVTGATPSVTLPAPAPAMPRSVFLPLSHAQIMRGISLPLRSVDDPNAEVPGYAAIDLAEGIYVIYVNGDDGQVAQTSFLLRDIASNGNLDSTGSSVLVQWLYNVAGTTEGAWALDQLEAVQGRTTVTRERHFGNRTVFVRWVANKPAFVVTVTR